MLILIPKRINILILIPFNSVVLQTKTASSRSLYIMDIFSQPFTAHPANHSAEMMKRLDILRNNQLFCDVTVTAEETQFPTHKVVLAAASPFFFSLLRSDMKEVKEDAIKLSLKEATASVVEDVLEYIYTRNLAITDEEQARNLIATAEYLLIPSLKTLSGRFLQEVLTVENCLFTYYLAVKYNCSELSQNSLQFINANFAAVMATEHFLSLDSKQVKELISSDDIVVNTEEEVFKGILSWVLQNKNERKGEFARLFSKIRVTCVSRDFLFAELVKEELVTQNNECLKFVLDAMQWIADPEKEDLPKPPRKCLETQTDVILACGGKRTLCYLPEQKAWYKLADSLFTYEDHAVTRLRDKVFIVGEKTEEPRMNRLLEYYLPSSNKRAAVETEYIGMAFSGLTVLKDCLYAVVENCDAEFTAVFKYDSVTSCWEEICDNDRTETCCVSDGNHLYLIGGKRYNVSFGNTVAERFDPNVNNWEAIADMKEARRSAFGDTLHGKIYVAGGVSKKSCEVYNPITNEWQLIASLQEERHKGSMVCCNGALYVLGGLLTNGQRELSVEVYDAETDEWRKETDIPIILESAEERVEPFKACFTPVCKSVISKLQPIRN